MQMQSSFAHRRALPTLAVAYMLILGLLAPSTAAGQTEPEDLIGFELPQNPFVDDIWVDPATRFNLDLENLEPAPDFDFATLQGSRVFAAGVELQEVEDDPLAELGDRHIRSLQVIDTLNRDITSVRAQITELEPEIDTLVTEIRIEEENEERLADEVFVREQAIAEFAIRAFIGEEQVDVVLHEPDTEFGENRVVTDEVLDDHRLQIAEREAEIARRENRRAGLEIDLDELRDQLRRLRGQRSELSESLEQAETLAEQTADSYELAVHARLPEFVAGTDIPLVALNAYVIAARTLETEAPQCQIHWSMLAGIGRIESIHGYFGDSTLDINGPTTEDIHGLPLDGRILSGAEYVTGGAQAPAATGRTESTEVTPVPAAEPAPAPAPAEPTATPAPAGDAAPGDTATAGNETAGDATTPAPAAPAPVVKRLALILDTDDGVLDGDTTYDRAVGPMQFIPSTWRLFDADGNGDEQTDPQNIYDAALAAARYLCASTPTMATPAGEQQAYFAYNHDLDYSNNVTQAGRGYRSLLTIEAPEIDALEIEGGSERYYLGILEGSQADELVEEDFDEILIDLDQLAEYLDSLDIPTW